MNLLSLVSKLPNLSNLTNYFQKSHDFSMISITHFSLQNPYDFQSSLFNNVSNSLRFLLPFNPCTFYAKMPIWVRDGQHEELWGLGTNAHRCQHPGVSVSPVESSLLWSQAKLGPGWGEWIILERGNRNWSIR